MWLALPDYNDIMDVRPGEIRLALDALGVQTIRECTLLEARCSLPGITGLEDAYRGRLEDLIYDGQNLDLSSRNRTRGRRGSSRPISGYWSMSTAPPCPLPWIWRRT